MLSNSGFGQMLEGADFEKIIHELLPQQEYDIDYNDLYDRLFSMYSSPIDLNSAGYDELQSLYFLSDEQISGIIEYRKKYGDFITFFELSTIEGFDRLTIEKLRKFVKITDRENESFKAALRNPSTHEFMLRYQTVLEQKKGFTTADSTKGGGLTSRYAGDPGRIFARYLMAKPGRYSLGFTTEKDPGEKVLWDPATKRYGMDYYSFHILLEKVAFTDKILIGDFSLEFGQGLIFGSGFRIGKGGDPVSTIRRNSLGLRPYRSAYEHKDFSGLATSFRVGLANFTLFYSTVNRDARIQSQKDESTGEFEYISSINTIGLHRTPSEIAAKHNLSDRSMGGNLNFSFCDQKLNIGLNTQYTEYNKAIIPGVERYRLYYFKGLSNYSSSIYVNYYFKKGHLFSEWAVSKSGGMAQSSGIIMSLASFIQTSIHIRNYDASYHAFNSNAFGENTSTGNERGFFWGLLIKPHERLQLSSYFDYFKFPWLKYQVDAPSDGTDFMASMEYTFNEQANIRVRYRDKIKSVNYGTGDNNLIAVHPKRTSRLMFDFEYNLDPSFSVRSWIQTANVVILNDQYRGFLLAQDLSYRTKKLTLSGRFALFDAEDYDSRMFIYEPDLLYVYSVPSFHNQGIRYYILFKYSISKNITIWSKYGQTKYYNLESIGSGLEEINGSTRSNLGFQLKINF
jgi:hypothetical protein